MITVRPARHADISGAVDMAFDMAQETDFKELGFSYDKVLALGHSMVDEAGRCLFLAESDGKLVGIMGGYIAEHFFSDDLLAYDQIIYVAPEFRHTRAALLLMDSFMKWAESKSVRTVLVSTSSGSEHAEKAGRFLRHYGLKKIGEVFRRIDNV